MYGCTNNTIEYTYIHTYVCIIVLVHIHVHMSAESKITQQPFS